MRDLCEDLSVLTCIERKDLTKLTDMSLAVLSHCVAEDVKDKELSTQVNIGLGVLEISYQDAGIHYRFIPSDDLQNEMERTYNTGKSRLKLNIEKALGSRLSNTYKDLF